MASSVLNLKDDACIWNWLRLVRFHATSDKAENHEHARVQNDWFPTHKADDQVKTTEMARRFRAAWA